VGNRVQTQVGVAAVDYDYSDAIHAARLVARAVGLELTTRQAELDSLVAQRAALSDLVALSTLNVTVDPRSEAAVWTPPGFVSGLESGWNVHVLSARYTGEEIVYKVRIIALCEFQSIDSLISTP
jgi:hypothetical protein